MTAYTNFLKLRAQAFNENVDSWDVVMNENLAIIDFVAGALNSKNRVVSGGWVSAGTGLYADYLDMVVEVGDSSYTIAAGSIACTASSLNYIYVSSAGAVVAATAAPTGDYVPLAVVDTNTSAVLRTGDLRQMAPYRRVENDCINGTFDIWQRATSQTANGYGADDRWMNNVNGTTQAVVRWGFTAGQTAVIGNPKYYSRSVITSYAGAGNYARKEHRILDVQKYSGKRVCIKFHAKADSVKSIALEGEQDFGSGGSASVVALSAQKIALTTSWAKYVAFIDFPSIIGKTVGTLSFSRITFWFDAGSDFNYLTDTLGQQSGAFEIAEVEIYVSDKELPVRRRTAEEELKRCQPYYCLGSTNYTFCYSESTSVSRTGRIPFPSRMITTPTMAITNNSSGTMPSWTCTTFNATQDSFNPKLEATVTADRMYTFGGNWSAEAEI